MDTYVPCPAASPASNLKEPETDARESLPRVFPLPTHTHMAACCRDIYHLPNKSQIPLVPGYLPPLEPEILLWTLNDLDASVKRLPTDSNLVGILDSPLEPSSTSMTSSETSLLATCDTFCPEPALSEVGSLEWLPSRPSDAESPAFYAPYVPDLSLLGIGPFSGEGQDRPAGTPSVTDAPGLSFVETPADNETIDFGEFIRGWTASPGGLMSPTLSVEEIDRLFSSPDQQQSCQSPNILDSLDQPLSDCLDCTSRRSYSTPRRPDGECLAPQQRSGTIGDPPSKEDFVVAPARAALSSEESLAGEALVMLSLAKASSPDPVEPSNDDASLADRHTPHSSSVDQDGNTVIPSVPLPEPAAADVSIIHSEFPKGSCEGRDQAEALAISKEPRAGLITMTVNPERLRSILQSIPAFITPATTTKKRKCHSHPLQPSPKKQQREEIRIHLEQVVFPWEDENEFRWNARGSYWYCPVSDGSEPVACQPSVFLELCEDFLTPGGGCISPQYLVRPYNDVPVVLELDFQKRSFVGSAVDDSILEIRWAEMEKMIKYPGESCTTAWITATDLE